MTSGPVDQLISIVAQGLPPLVVVAAGVVGLMLPRTHQVRVLVQAVVALVLAVLAVKVAGGLHADPRPFVVDPTVHPLFTHPADKRLPVGPHDVRGGGGRDAAGVRRRTGVVLVVLGVVGGLAGCWRTCTTCRTSSGAPRSGWSPPGWPALVAPRLTAWGPLHGLDERWSRTRRPSAAVAGSASVIPTPVAALDRTVHAWVVAHRTPAEVTAAQVVTVLGSLPGSSSSPACSSCSCCATAASDGGRWSPCWPRRGWPSGTPPASSSRAPSDACARRWPSRSERRRSTPRSPPGTRCRRPSCWGWSCCSAGRS